ncbi:hypothetical protein H2198_003300 [Neophaeococcomyces mojaviensis]|uniref:Uncharacterized protein n=1 Tax=Neophaeococcomyces mojaviensis TaxID=3383035 RepID=A0ACC3ABR9_9EURO|nr:hypothetical protein H2198_003300 [Knufia sp. JES_112]
MAETNGTIGQEQQDGLVSSTIPPPATATHPAQKALPPQSASWNPATLAMHADDPLNLLTDVAPPIHVSTTFRYASDPSVLRPFRLSDRPGNNFPYQDADEHCYSRLTTHSTSRLEAILESLLHNPCVTYSSGLSAIHALLVHLNPKRVSIGDGYHGSHGVLALHTRLSGMKVLDLDCDANELQAGDLIMLETPVNPTGKALNISHYAEKAHSKGAYLMVDSTFAPPPLQDPFTHGADIVMHSGTKYIGGHSDMLCGVLSIRQDLAQDWLPRLLEDRVFLGSVMGGLEGWLGVRSVRTLELRVMRQSESAGRLVDALSGALTGATVGTGLSQSDVETIRKVVEDVQHASLQSDDWKAGWLKKQMSNGFGPVFAVSLKSDELARRLPSKLHLFHHATSLGGVESLIEWRTMTDGTVSRNLLRVSVGVEDYRDLLDDMLQGFRSLTEELEL